MDEDGHVATEMPNTVQGQDSEKGADQISSPNIKPEDDKFKAVLTELEALPFHDENQRTVFFENINRLQDRHIIQIFKLGVVSLQTSTTEGSEFLEDVMKLFEICLSFCYTTDVSKRVAFEYYASALKFCFRPEPTRCLSTEVLSSLLELVQIFQKGNLATIVCDQKEQQPNPKYYLKGTKHFFLELLEVFERRQEDGDISEIVRQTKRFAAADAKASCIKEHKAGNMRFRNDHVVSPIFLTNWINLLKLANVSNSFASMLAKQDPLSHWKDYMYFPILLPDNFLPDKIQSIPIDVHESDVRTIFEILDEMKSNDSELHLCFDEERLSIFFKHMRHSRQTKDATITSLKLIATKTISTGVLREVLDQFFEWEKVNFTFSSSQNLVSETLNYTSSVEIKATAFAHLLKVLTLLPDGRIVNSVLKLWREISLTEYNYQHCKCLFDFFLEESNGLDQCGLQERAESTLNFLHWLPPFLLRFIIIWGPLLSLFIKVFPNSFQKRPEVLVFIHKAVVAAQFSAEKRQEYVTPIKVLDQHSQFLKWVSQQCFSEEVKSEMVWLLMCTDGGSLSKNGTFSENIIKTLTLHQEMPLRKKAVIVRDVTRLAQLLQGQAKMDFEQCVENIISGHSKEVDGEIFAEMFDFVKRFRDKKGPINTTSSKKIFDFVNDDEERLIKAHPMNNSQLLSRLSKIPISNDRRLKLLQMTKGSEDGLMNVRRMLSVLDSLYLIREEEANEYLDILFSVFDSILKGKNDLCEKFCEEVQKYWSSSPNQKVWAEVAQLISLGSFKEEIEGYCCCNVLSAASNLTSSEMLQLFSEVRSSAVKVVKLLKDRNDIHSTCAGVSECVPVTFVSSLSMVVSSNKFDGMEKLLLVKTLCDSFLSYPESLSERAMENALSNLFPLSCFQDNCCLHNRHLLRWEIYHMEAILNNSTIITQLSRIPVYSFCGVISKMNCNLLSANSISEVYHFLGSLGDLDQTFFENFSHVLKIAIGESNFVEDVLHILMELVSIVRSTRSELIPLTMVTFGHLLESRVDRQEGLLFLKDVIMKWKFSPDVNTFSYLEVPRLLWKVYTTAKTSADRSELIDRLQHILKNARENVHLCCAAWLGSLETREKFLRKVYCCEFEWLVFCSSLSKDEAALACNLMFHFRYLQLRCFDFSDVYIKDCCINFVPQLSESEKEEDVCVPLVTNATPASRGNAASVSEPHDKLLTPLMIAERVIFHLKRMLRKNEDLAEMAFIFCRAVKSSPCCSEQECKEREPSFDDYVEVFLSLLFWSSSTEVLLHWINQDSHHVCQCSEVILNACKQSLFTGDVAMEALLRFQGAVSAILERMRLDAAKDEPIHSLLGCPVSCFRRLMPQLKSLSNLLEFKLSVDTKTAVLGIFQTNVQAGFAIGEVLSFCSCEQQALHLAKRFKRHCQEEMILKSSAQEEFVWQSLKAFRRFCINSSEDLFARYERLNNLYDREDPYGFNRLPKWRQLMLTGGFSAQVIDWWCVAFLMTPLEDISSRDVDSIVNLSSGTLKLVESQLSETIQRCLFPTDGFRVSPEEGIKRQETKERLRLAKLLGEFINILKLLKPGENRKDAVIKEMLVCGCNKLCDAHENQARRNDLYIIQENQLKALITEVFGKQHKRNDDAENVCHTHKAVDGGSKGSPAFSRQSSCSNENLPLIMNHREVYQPLLVLVRRWLSRIAVKPNLASLTLKIVHLVFSVLSNEQGQELLLRVHSKINDRILSVEENEALMAQLQASGYNQNWQGHWDLWSSPKLECSGYISKVEAPDGRRYIRKLTQVLRQCWNQWKDVLSKLRIFHIKVGKSDVRTDDLFGLHASLEEMEQQVSAVNERVNQIQKNDEIIQQVIELMVRTEQQHRARIKTLYKGTKVREITFFSPFMISFYGTQIGTRFTILGVIELIYVIKKLKSKHF